MKNTIKKSIKVIGLIGLIGLINASCAHAVLNTGDFKNEIKGVWDLSTFEYISNDGITQPWCEGAYGSIVYYQNRMSVSINCKSDPTKTLFYSGPYQVEGDTVVHQVQNYSDNSLKKVFRRKIEMQDKDHLALSGVMSNGGTARLTWKRRERFSENNSALPGVYALTLSTNDFEGRTGVPYCTGVFGSILYTPGGYVSVSLNCQAKINESQNEPADIHGRKYFYSGTYTVGVEQLIHMPENGTMVEHIGHAQVRGMKLENGVLTLTGTNGSAFTAVWTKMNSN